MLLISGGWGLKTGDKYKIFLENSFEKHLFATSRRWIFVKQGKRLGCELN
jgi:hypothetical protein